MTIERYIIAGLSVLVFILGIALIVDKTRINGLQADVAISVKLAKAQEKQIVIQKKASQKDKEQLDEDYKRKSAALHSTISGLRKHNTSLLSSLPASTGSPDEITFDREALDRAISRYRDAIQKGFGEGSDCQISLSIAQQWVQRETKIYE